MTHGNGNDPAEDMFAETRMTFGDHLEDLRFHLWRAIKGFGIAMALSFFIAPAVLRFIAAPVEKELAAFYEERVKDIRQDLKEGTNAGLEEANEPQEMTLEMDAQEASRLGMKVPESESERVKVNVWLQPVTLAIILHRATQLVGRRPGLSTLGPMEAFMAYIKVSLLCGLVLGSPWIFWQLWLFVAAGLYRHEKRLVNVYLPFSLGLFLSGVFLCEIVVLPKALSALLWFNRWTNLEPDLRFNEWLGFAIMMPLVFGLSFQLPLAMMFLDRIGILTAKMYLQKWRIAIFAIHVVAAILMPTPDPLSMELMALPLMGLYGLGILLCRLNGPKQGQEGDVPDPEEMVEV